MSLEAKIEALTEALKENNDLLRTLTAKAKAGTTGTSNASSDKGDEGDKGDKGRQGRPAGSKNKEKAPTAANMKDAAQAFLNEAGDDEDEYGRRKKAVMTIVKKFGAAKFTEIEEEHRAEALKLLKGADKAPAEDDDVV